MKRFLIHIILIICCHALSQAQDGAGAIALHLPARNSLMFNKYILSPTLSYARENDRYIAINNKRELAQVGDAPQTYLASFSGRFSEKIGAGIGLFQRNFGVFTTFGGIVNFAYNAQLASESNLTFGLNLIAYNSSINLGQVVTTVTDPMLTDVPSSFITTISPGINYGGGFLDVGVTINNLVTYDVSTSQILKEQTQRGIQGHLMYSGYIDSYGFFDNSKFSALGRAEFQEDASIYSGTVMLTVPKGFWLQGGYNTLYGGSAGVGLNITSQIALEYNYEKSLGNFISLGSSHELTLAFILPTQNAYDFSKNRITGLLNFEKKRKRSSSKRRRLTRNNTKQPSMPSENSISSRDMVSIVSENSTTEVAEENTRIAVAEQTRINAKEQERLVAEASAKQEAEEQERLVAAEQVRLNSEVQAKRKAEVAAKQEVEEQARLAAAKRVRLDAEVKARLAAEATAKLEAEEQERLVAAEQARLDAEYQARRQAEANAKQEAEEQARLAAAAQARLDAEEQVRLEANANKEAKEQVQLAATEQTKLDTEEGVKLAAEAKASIQAPNDDLGRSLQILTAQTEAAQSSQKTLLVRLRTAVNGKDEDLKNLKKENDLSEQGIFVEPKPFKSVSSENARIESLQLELDESLEAQNAKIEELEEVYIKRMKKITGNDETNRYYKNAITAVKTERKQTRIAKTSLMSFLERIKVATQFERSRRIKRAAFNNEEDRYKQDQATLKFIKQSTPLNSTSLQEKDFDFGDKRSRNIQILKNVENTNDAYYIILAVHGSISKRDDFVKKVIASGYSEVNFFYDINTSKYYIYYDKTRSLQDANKILDYQNDVPYAKKVSIIKIEN